MKSRKSVYAFVILALLGVGISIAGDRIKPQYSPNEKAFYLSDAEEAFLQPGLNLEIQKVDFAPPSVVVTFRLSDINKQGLDRLGIATPGPIAMQFILSRIRPGDTQYTNYILRTFNSAALGSVQDPWSDPANATNSAYTDLGDGVYKYTFAAQITNPDLDSTTTLGVQAGRNLTDFGLKRYSANATYDFVPSGAPVTQVRDVVRIENCNQCHDPLAWHGGGDRIDTKLCVLCHTPQNTDPVTGGTLDFKVIVHRIHMGSNLPSVTGKALNVLGVSGLSTATVATGATQAPKRPDFVPPGKPAIINGDDVSSVVWPQDVRNCTTCHKGGTQSDNYKSNPNRAACGSCHDDVDFTTGKNHPGGIQVDDNQCAICHQADTGLEFDLSVSGAHTMPWKSKQLKGLKLAIISASGKPGGNVTVNFTVTDNSGSPVAPSSLGRLYININGPTSDYSYILPATGFQGVMGNEPGNNPWIENSLTPTAPATPATCGSTSCTYTTTAALPANAEGTWAVGAEAFRNVTIPGSLLGQSFAVREFAFNPVIYFSVDGSKVVPRRKVVDVANKCNVCHETLALHGGARRNATEYCELCHNPNHVDENTPGTTVNFRTMIMGLHMGEKLDETYIINNRVYNGLRFPGDQRDCAKCHVGSTYTVPLPDGLIPTINPSFFFSPLQPTASACLGCHNGLDAAAHAYQQTAPFGESCPVCHEEGAEFAVSKVHAH